MKNVKIYFEPRDWWIGYYRGDEYNYVCLLPTLVIRWLNSRERKSRRELIEAIRKAKNGPPMILSDHEWTTVDYRDHSAGAA